MSKKETKKEVKKETKKIDFKNILMFGIGALVIIAIIVITLLKKSNTMTCTLYQDQSVNNYTKNTTYKIITKRNKIENIYINQEMKSKNTTFLAYFEDLLKKQYPDKKGYTYSSKINKDNYTASASISFNEIDLDEFMKINEIVKDNEKIKSSIKKNNKLLLEDAKKMFENMGATCK